MRYFKFHYIKEAHYDYRVYDGALTATRQRAIREKTREILNRELRCEELGLRQRAMALLGLAVNEVRIARLP